MTKNGYERETKISIIVPVYNAAQYIEEAFISVINQTYKNWELIFVDDASTDESREILKRLIKKYQDDPILSKKIKLKYLDSNYGPATARNMGIAIADGRYLAYLDADDLWRPEKLEKQLNFMQQHACAFSYTGYAFTDCKAEQIRKKVHVPKMISYKEALLNTTISTITVMIDRAQIPEQLLLMPEEMSREDTATWWRILKNGYNAFGLDEVLSIYRRHRASYSSNKFKAVKGTYKLYRSQEGFSTIHSLLYLGINLLRAVKRRL